MQMKSYMRRNIEEEIVSLVNKKGNPNFRIAFFVSLYKLNFWID